MSARTSALKAVDVARTVLSKSTIDLRPYTLTVRTRTWSGDRGTSTPVDSDLAITPRPKVEQVSTREIASSGGRYLQGDMHVSQITPQYAGGGYTPTQLKPDAPDDRTEVLYLLTGPDGGEYRFVDGQFDANLHYELVLRRQRSTP